GKTDRGGVGGVFVWERVPYPALPHYRVERSIACPDFHTVIRFSGEARTAMPPSGSLRTARTSASYPALSCPDFGAWGPKVIGAFAVAASIACNGVIPASTRWTSSCAF